MPEYTIKTTLGHSLGSVDFDYTDGVLHIRNIEQSGSYGNILPALSLATIVRIKNECEAYIKKEEA